jgi:hypothetical protein
LYDFPLKNIFIDAYSLTLLNIILIPYSELSNQATSS